MEAEKVNTTVQIIIIIAVVAGAVWYLYRRFRRMLDPSSKSCGCGCGSSGCGSGNACFSPPVVRDDEQGPR
ncbi:MAG: FeoB-associated Cys-rich membrane protein [Desulfobulbaceae bacterium]|nr:FeoB-associated Cys-rich membrane protein [Desulfobulbaceae bacterium]